MIKIIDILDRKIISILEKNARISCVEIAKQVERSEATIRHRIQKMEENEIIQKFTIEVNPKIDGYTQRALIGINVQSNSFLKVFSKLKHTNEILSTYRTNGAFSILCEVKGKDSEQITNMQERIEEIEGVIEVIPIIIHKD